MNDRRIRLVRIAPELLQEIITQGNELHCVVTEGLPLDATPRHSSFDPVNGCAVFVYEHESFAPVALGEEIPILRVTFETIEGLTEEGKEG